MHSKQHGFRSDQNTVTAISEVADFIGQNIFFSKQVLAVFLDIQAAFDTIDPKHIKQMLLSKNLDSDLVEWYYEYITHRNITVTINDTTISKTISTGFPQGSAKFWIIAFDEAIEIINENNMVGHGFADDCCTMIAGNNLHHMMSRTQKTINKLIEWGENVGLKFNPDKTVVIVFTKANLKNTNIRIESK